MEGPLDTLDRREIFFSGRGSLSSGCLSTRRGAGDVSRAKSIPMTTMGAMRHRPVLVFVLLAGVLFEGTLAMQFSTAFAASVFAGVEEILTVPWYQGIDQVVAGFGSKWAVLEDARAGGITNVNMNNTFSYIWSLYKPFNAREISLDFLYVSACWFLNTSCSGSSTLSLFFIIKSILSGACS